MVNPKKYVGILCVMLYTMINFSVPCLADNTLIFGSVSGSPPLSYEEDGVAKGFFLDVFRETAKRAGYDISFVCYPMKRLETNLQSGRIDGTVHITHTKKRDEFLIYSTAPVLSGISLVFVKKGREFTFKTISDLYGKRIGVILGFKVMNEEFEKAVQQGKIITESVSTHDQNLKKLLAGRIDCLIGTENLTWYHANELDLAKHLVALAHPIADIFVYFAISKHTKNIPDPLAVMRDMNAALESTKSDGTYETLLKKYKLLLFE
ncbi:MAG: transporter substrate-binding domain-containing protein [Proteobacteria bacterium]|nr:transporter substrate-binding domain-containing protein [Pseudomonadota bacterium]